MKGELVRSIVHEVGAPVSNPDFRVASAGFAALVAVQRPGAERSVRT